MKKLFIKQNQTIKDALKQTTVASSKCLLVVKKDKLLGTLSDGDLRKAILSGASLSESIDGFYNASPTVLLENNYSITDAKKIFLEKNFDLIPIINSNNIIVNLLMWSDVFNEIENNTVLPLNVPVVIMAGGKGTRLEPFTKVLPKPLVPIHETPIIEHIIKRFVKYGCTEYFISINYKGKIIKAYFDELNPKYNVDFIEEESPLGTAGSLGLVRKKFNKPFFVTNCDIIIEADYNKLYNYHIEGNYDITLVASAKEYIIPYGTCKLNDQGDLSYITEKPKYDFLINTGLYVLSQEILNIIPKGKLYHITDLITDIIKANKKIGVFPINDDNWIDTGQWAEYKKAVESLS